MAIKIPAVKNTKVIVPEVNEVTFTDGIKIQVTGANNTTTRKPLYLAAYAEKNNPKPSEPIVMPPIITPGKNREMTLKELSEVKSGIGPDEDITIKALTTSDKFDLSNIRGNIDFSQVLFQGNRNVVLDFYGDCSGIRLLNAKAKDCLDLIYYDVRDKVYTGKSGSFIDGFTIQGFNVDNIRNTFTSRGGGFQDNGTINGVFKGFNFINNTIKNCPDLGEVLWLGYAEDALISGNIMDNLNTKNNNHNGIFSIWGLNGRVTGNKLTNHQGDMLRCQPAQLSTGKVLEIDNNIIAKSRWYSAFEAQAHNVYQNKAFKCIDINVHHNTALILSTEKTREGQLFDEYNLGGGKLYIDYNLGAEMFTGASKGITDMVNSNYDNGKFVGPNNRYFKTWQEAVTDLTSFKSKISGAGAQ